MKHINTYITEYIVKKKLDKFIDSEDRYDYCPKTKEELIDNIKELFDKGETNLNCIDTSNITDMSNLFTTIMNKTNNIDVSKWNVSNVTNMKLMFNGFEDFDCDLSSWDVSKVEDMNGMFFVCKKFKGKGLEYWDVSKVKDMNGIFYYCTNFNHDLSNWNVSNVEDMEYMFVGCENFDYDLSSWDVSKVENMYSMFQGCKKFKGKGLEN